MKLKIFNRGKGWYVFATNHKDPNDIAYMNVFFPSTCPEPVAEYNDKNYSVKDIEVIEGKYTSYKKTIGLTIFKYELLTDKDLDERQYQVPLNDGNSDMFGRQNTINTDDLPFY